MCFEVNISFYQDRDIIRKSNKNRVFKNFNIRGEKNTLYYYSSLRDRWKIDFIIIDDYFSWL